jgi:hypothetical protein
VELDLVRHPLPNDEGEQGGARGLLSVVRTRTNLPPRTVPEPRLRPRRDEARAPALTSVATSSSAGISAPQVAAGHLQTVLRVESNSCILTARQPVTERDKRVLQVRIRTVDLESLRALLLEGINAGCRPHLTEEVAGVTMQAYVSEEELDRLKERGYDIEVLADASATGLERQAEVGRGDRFEGGTIAPRGLGRKIRRAQPRE